jgi:predicted Zn-dependent protease
VLERAQAARPNDQRLALTLAGIYNAAGDSARAIALLENEALRRPGQGAALPLARAQAYAAANRWGDAEVASRAALAEASDNVFARRQLAALLLRNNDAAGAESLIREGLRSQPANPQLQQTLREARSAIEDARSLTRGLNEDPSRILFQPTYRGVEIPP